MQSTDRAYRRPDRYSIDRDLMTAIDDASTLFPNFSDLNNDTDIDLSDTMLRGLLRWGQEGAGKGA